jgi:hypothetical protein
MWYLTAGTLLLDCERHSLTTFRRNVPTVPMLCSHKTATWYERAPALERGRLLAGYRNKRRIQETE